MMTEPLLEVRDLSVAFRQGERDNPVIVTRDRPLFAGRRIAIWEEVEGQAVFGVIGAGFEREGQTDQRIEQRPLRAFHAKPLLSDLTVSGVRHNLVVTTCTTMLVCFLFGYKPIANSKRVIGAKAIPLVCSAVWLPEAVRRRFESVQFFAIRRVAQSAMASLAYGVFKEKILPAEPTLKRLHRQSRQNRRKTCNA